MAQLRITFDAEIEHWFDSRAVVISSSACACGDELLVHSLDDNGQMSSCTAKVMACEPILGHPARYRVSLALTTAPAPARLDGLPVA
jgi:hypothetical protein